MPFHWGHLLSVLRFLLFRPDFPQLFLTSSTRSFWLVIASAWTPLLEIGNGFIYRDSFVLWPSVTVLAY
jgi:hypothetical protein